MASAAHVDAFAVESQRRAAEAISAGRFDRSIIVVRNGNGEIALTRDEHPRPGKTQDELSKLRLAFAQMGAARADGESRTKLKRVLDVLAAGPRGRGRLAVVTELAARR